MWARSSRPGGRTEGRKKQKSPLDKRGLFCLLRGERDSMLRCGRRQPGRPGRLHNESVFLFTRTRRLPAGLTWERMREGMAPLPWRRAETCGQGTLWELSDDRRQERAVKKAQNKSFVRILQNRSHPGGLDAESILTPLPRPLPPSQLSPMAAFAWEGLHVTVAGPLGICTPFHVCAAMKFEGKKKRSYLSLL